MPLHPLVDPVARADQPLAVLQNEFGEPTPLAGLKERPQPVRNGKYEKK
ncbi:hypothetical protein [Streptomyces sp. 2131.1]|nr:hypothetical protein [Streptomyces sp. 2131.1]